MAGAEEPATPTSNSLLDLAREIVEISADWTGAGEDSWRPIRVDLDIRDGWHINSNPPSLGSLIPTRIEGKARGVIYPVGEKFLFEFADQEISVYTGRVRIRGEVSDDREVLEVTYQACDERRCLPPVTRELRVSN